jgi:hypothetical protein
VSSKEDTPEIAALLSRWAQKVNDASPIKPADDPPPPTEPAPTRRKKKRRR